MTNATNPKNDQTTGLSYRDSGVDIDAGNALVERIKPSIKRTQRKGMMGSLGGFGGLFALDTSQYKEPILVSGTDGVGTKLKLAIESGKHDSVGIDLVAMCVNDILVMGAEPLFFLDYYATSKLDVDVAADVINGIAKGCELAGAGLIGGETAEMPGMYAKDDYDLAGFCVGVVEKSKIIDGSNVGIGHKLIGLASSGIHSNGYSLVRKVIEVSNTDVYQSSNDQPALIEQLMQPTRIYVKTVLDILKDHQVDAMVHVTGGGLTENIPRVLPDTVNAEVNTKAWQRPPVFNWLQENGNISDAEMLRTFNCGIGFILCVPENEADAILAKLSELNEEAYLLGQIIDGNCEVSYV